MFSFVVFSKKIKNIFDFEFNSKNVNKMRKFLPIILIVTILAGSLLPFGFLLNEKTNRVEVQKNNASAEYNYIFKITPTMSYKTITLDIEKTENSEGAGSYSVMATSYNANIQVYATVLDKEDKKVADKYVTFGTAIKNQTIEFKRLEPNYPYKTKIVIKERILSSSTQGTAGSIGDKDFKDLATYEIDTPTTENTDVSKQGQQIDTGGTSTTLPPKNNFNNLPACGFSNPLMGGEDSSIGGCFVRLFYYTLFVPTSYLFAFSGALFDYTFAFSINSSSYDSDFILQGWGIIRDFCNIFFIFIMLYIAISTILNINGSKTKEMIRNVIIVGLLINFSLFFTQVVIDASNILARVFYTSDAISVEKDGHAGTSNIVNKSNNVIPLSEALVSQIDPQQLVAKSDKVMQIESKLTKNTNTAEESGMSPNGWIIVTILASIFNIVGFIVFLSVALIFIGRIAGLWIAMIFSPLAFFSYIAPELASLPKFGYKAWLPETLKMAFLAPIFIFLLYLILAFLNKGLGVVGIDQESKGLMFVMYVTIPFAILMVLLFQAKDIAVKYSGEIGKAVSGFASKAGGLALGVGMGATALGLRSSLGAIAAGGAKSEKLKAKADKGGFRGFIAKQQLSVFDKISKKSFDVRNTGIAQKAESALGTKFSGKGTLTKVAEGGYAGALDRRLQRDEKIDENYNAAVDRQRKIDRRDRKDPVDPTTREAMELDRKAREWNEEYRKHLNAEKTAWIRDHGDLSEFSESDIKLQYIKTHAQAFSADEKKRQNKKDIADNLEYGSDYVKRRNEAQEAKRIAGLEFNEQKWREDENIEKIENITEGEAREISEFRKGAKQEKESLSGEQKEALEAKKQRLINTIQVANNEKEKLNEKIRTLGFGEDDIRDIDGTNETGKVDVSKLIALKERIKTKIENEEETLKRNETELHMLDVEITQLTGKNLARPSRYAHELLEEKKRKYMDKQTEINKNKKEIKELENLKNKESNQKTINEQSEILNEIREKLK